MAEMTANFEQIGGGPNRPLVAVAFSGIYLPGSQGNECGLAMIDFLRSVLAKTKLAGILFDLTALDYVWGDTIAGLAMPLFEKGKGFRPSVIVATGRTARALGPLLEPRILLGLAGMKLFDSRDEALAHLQRLFTKATG